MRTRQLLGVSALLAAVIQPACGDSSEPEKEKEREVGEVCDPDLENGGCSEIAVCSSLLIASDAETDGAAGAPSEGEAEHRCLLARGSECEPAEDLCSPNLTCASLAAGGHRCFEPVMLRGVVVDSADSDPVPGAQVMAIDAEGVAVTDVATSSETGTYELELPVEREEDGSPVDESYRLRAAAQDFQPFPAGVRVALPIDASSAVDDEGVLAIESALTKVSLIGLPAGARTTVSGSVEGLSGSSHPVGGVLVVAASGDEAFSAVTDRSGRFTIFNVTQGSYEVRGYAVDLPLGTASVSVGAEAVEGVDLTELDEGTTTVTGNVQIVNAPGGSLTSVILVVEDTFNETAATGEVPRGLRAPRSGAPAVSGDFSIAGVPAGDYVVLAAYENDGLVRDPDTNIGGTEFVRLSITAGENAEMALPESFKVTQALSVISPGAEQAEAVDGAPVLRWADDSSESWYEVRVFDALGNEVWSVLDLPGVSGQDEVSLDYEGPLEPGMYYQFRVVSWRQPGGGEASPIATTEDLRGVFFVPAE